MDYRTTNRSYSDYLKSKGSVNLESNINCNYNKAYNKALKLSLGNTTEKKQSVTLLNELYKIKKDPEVLILLQNLVASNPEC
jgi:hypothetical protein